MDSTRLVSPALLFFGPPSCMHNAFLHAMLPTHHSLASAETPTIALFAFLLLLLRAVTRGSVVCLYLHIRVTAGRCRIAVCEPARWVRLRRGLSQCLRPRDSLCCPSCSCGYPVRRCVFDIAIVSAPACRALWAFLALDGEWWRASPEQKRGWIFEGGRGCPTGVDCPSSSCCSDPLWFSRRSPGSGGGATSGEDLCV